MINKLDVPGARNTRVGEDGELEEELQTVESTARLMDGEDRVFPDLSSAYADDAVSDEDGLELGPARGEWGNSLDFLFSCISVSVGLGNVWRFPYLCYKNGGGAFLIVYFISMAFCGVPIFLQEVAIGQYLGSGGMTLVAQVAPMLKGVGIATMCVVGFLDIYYSVIIAWTLFYLFMGFSDLQNGVPWQSCDGWWNTKNCFHKSEKNATVEAMSKEVHDAINATVNGTLIRHKREYINKTALDRQYSPVEEYWERRVLQMNMGLEEGLGSMQWELAGCLFLAWIIVYSIIAKGLHTSGKIIWFTALFPYFVMIILLFRAITLPGAWDGLAYYVHVDWNKLAEGRTWIDGATQIFFAYSVGMGALPALGSYNKFHHNCFRDAIITCIVNTLTCLLAGVLVFSILGYMANIQETNIHGVVNSGPGLVFLTYPDMVLSLPASVVWATIFFLMLLTLGVDSEFCNVEALVTGIVDNWPDQLLRHRRLFTIILSICLFLLGLPMVTQGGVFLFQLMDFYSCSGMALLWVCLWQTIALGWFFGAARFCDCVEQMTGHRPGLFWYLCWKFFAPAVMLSVFIFYCISYQPVTYGDNYAYPKWAEFMGLCMSFTSMIWVPGYAIYYLIATPGTLKQNLIKGLTPDIQLRREARVAAKDKHGLNMTHDKRSAARKRIDELERQIENGLDERFSCFK